MAIINYYSPFREIEQMRRNFRDLLSDEDFKLPVVDVSETEDAFIFEAELPGFTKDEIEITATPEELIIEAEHKEEVEEKEEGEEGEDKPRFIRKERRSRKFRRAFRFGNPVDPQNSEVNLENGVLTVSIAKSEDTKPVKLLVE